MFVGRWMRRGEGGGRWVGGVQAALRSITPPRLRPLGCQEQDGVSVNLVVCMGPRRRLRRAHLALRIGAQQTSPDSFVSHPSLDKHGQEMNVVLQ